MTAIAAVTVAAWVSVAAGQATPGGVVAPATAAVCAAVRADRDDILASDLGLPSEAVVGLAPAPGVARRFTLPELRRIAERLGIPAPDREACVTRPAAPLDPERISEALRSTLPGATIELLDHSRYPVPEGALVFPVAGLRGSIWRGFVQYGGRHRIAVWAKVKATVRAARVVATADLRPGQPIDVAAVSLETREQLPEAGQFAAAVEEVAGKAPRRTIRAGTAIRTDWLAAPHAVERGETVRVEVRAGAAVLQFTAQAQRAGTVGQTIPVLNPISKKPFLARVEGKGKVTVGGGQ